MQSSTEGTPAARERSVPEWQYWQSISNSPAWCLWLKGMGWIGPGASGSQAASCDSHAESDGQGLFHSAGISILSSAGACLPLTMGRSEFDVSSSSSIPNSKHNSSNSAVVYLWRG